MGKDANNSQAQEASSTEEFYDHLQIVIDPKQSPIRVDKFLLDRLEGISRNRIQEALKAGNITIGNNLVKANHKVRPGEVITIFFPRRYDHEAYPILPEALPLDIRHEDEDVMVIHKPAGLVVHPAIGHPSGTLVNGLVHYFQEKQLPIKEGNFADRAGLVHRIDKETSGLLVIAKNDYAMTHLARQFYNHTVRREYLALVWGEPLEEQGTISGHIGRNPRNRFKRMVFEEGDAGKHAVTHYEVIDALYYVSLIKCRLETGRTHQIRVHMSYLGHPIFNDKRYGGDTIIKGTIYTKYKQFVDNCFKICPRQALHAKSLGFIHPATGEELYFEADLPEDFSRLLEKWRKYLSSR